jgi:hypothetical protein
MATPSTMLPQGHSSAPKLTPDVPRELQLYFKELELLFELAQVVNNTEKKSMLADTSTLTQQTYGKLSQSSTAPKPLTSSNPLL